MTVAYGRVSQSAGVFAEINPRVEAEMLMQQRISESWG